MKLKWEKQAFGVGHYKAQNGWEITARLRGYGRSRKISGYTVDHYGTMLKSDAPSLNEAKKFAQTYEDRTKK